MSESKARTEKAHVAARTSQSVRRECGAVSKMKQLQQDTNQVETLLVGYTRVTVSPYVRAAALCLSSGSARNPNMAKDGFVRPLHVAASVYEKSEV